MPSLTITDLTNAKLDVDHIAEVATSMAGSATDRIGNVKDTVKGAVDSLKAFNSRGAWAASTAYALKDVVTSGGTWYACVVAHTSSTAFATDSASKWRVHQGATLADLGAGGIPVFAVGAPTPGVSSQFFAAKAISTHAQYGFLDNSQINYATAGFQAHASFNDNVTISGTQTSDHNHSFQSYPHYASSGALGRLSSFWSQIEHTGTGTISEASLFKANTPLGTGPITTLYGVYIAAMTRGATNYAVYAEGVAPSFFGGGLIIGQLGTPATIKYNTSTGELDITPRDTYAAYLKTAEVYIGYTRAESVRIRNNRNTGELELTPRDTYGAWIASEYTFFGYVRAEAAAVRNNRNTGNFDITPRTGYNANLTSGGLVITEAGKGIKLTNAAGTITKTITLSADGLSLILT